MEKKRRNAFITAGLAIFICTLVSAGLFAFVVSFGADPSTIASKSSEDPEEPIKWVEFDVPYEAMKKAMDIDIESFNENVHVSWIDALAYLGALYGGDFSRYSPDDMDSFVSRIRDGESVGAVTKKLKLFDYYSRAYGAVLGGFLGEYQIRLPDDGTGKSSWKKTYGLKAFSPVAEGFYYSDFDDFGESRSYGYSRRHLGHDMMAASGTPVIAVESGTVEALGWNQYGGWRIGIRTHDTERYYYYAHLRKDCPYAKGLYIGAEVTAGDVIGYTGQTGYSLKENVNNIDTPHLHFGLQLVFDEEAKDSPTQIWIDLYDITRLLSEHKCSVIKDENTGEYKRKYPFAEENHFLKEMMASAKTTDAQQVELPIVMYHSLLKDPEKQGKYVISPKLFERDLKYIKQKGYTPVFMKDVIAYVEDGDDLPEKPIVLSFDDGYFNNYYYAHPLLEKYNAKAVISIVGKMSDEFSSHHDENPSYAHVTWDHILDMHLSGYWEIQNHSYNCHTYEKRNGVSQVSTETYKDYAQFLMSDLGYLQDKIAYVTGVAPNTFTYPFGAFSDNTDEIIRQMGFKATLSCTEGVSTIKKGDPDCLFKLKRHLRPPDKSPVEFFTFLK